MSLIKNLKLDKNGWFANGSFDSISLFQEEINLILFVDDGATESDAIRCINHYNGLLTKDELYKDIENGLTSFFLYMYDEWNAMKDIYSNIATSLEPIMHAHENNNSLITFLSKPTFYVYPQLEGEIGYGIECECPWEPEHQCMILIRNDKVVYIGPSEGNDPWQDEEDYYCIWNDED